MLDERLADRAIDVVVRHVVADAVGHPAQRQLAQVARAQHQRVVQIGQAEQVRSPLARLHVLECHVVHRLAAAKGWPMSRNICLQAGRMSISPAVTPSAFISLCALLEVSLLVAKPGMV